jgi:hypothetical protein
MRPAACGPFCRVAIDGAEDGAHGDQLVPFEACLPVLFEVDGEASDGLGDVDAGSPTSL